MAHALYSCLTLMRSCLMRACSALKSPSDLIHPCCLFGNSCMPYVARSCSLQGKYKMTMGLEPMNPLDWVEIDECYEEEVAMRKELIKNNRSIVIHSLPGVRPSALLPVLSGQLCTKED